MRTERRALRLGGEVFLEEATPKPVGVSQKERKGKDKCRELVPHHIRRQSHCSVLGKAGALNSTVDKILPIGPKWPILSLMIQGGLLNSPLSSFHD